MTSPPRKRTGGNPQHEWLVNVEDERALEDIAGTLISVGNRLRAAGEVKLNGVAVRPLDPCEFMVRYERLPHGELKLKLELTWEPDAVEYRDSGDTGLQID